MSLVMLAARCSLVRSLCASLLLGLSSLVGVALTSRPLDRANEYWTYDQILDTSLHVTRNMMWFHKICMSGTFAA
jgi:hypothetical protein